MPSSQIGGVERHRHRFRVAWREHGRRNRRSFATEQEAHAFLAHLRSSAQPPHGRVKGNLTVEEVVQNWYRGHRRNLASGTRRDYEGRIRRDLAGIGATRASEIVRNPRLLRDLYLSMTPTSARRLHAILHQAFGDAMNHGEVERNPCALVKPKRPRAAERLIPTPAEVESIIAVASKQDVSWGLYVDISATLGTRRGETCALRWEDLDFEHHRVHIRRAVCKGTSGQPNSSRPRPAGNGPW